MRACKTKSGLDMAYAGCKLSYATRRCCFGINGSFCGLLALDDLGGSFCLQNVFGYSGGFDSVPQPLAPEGKPGRARDRESESGKSFVS